MCSGLGRRRDAREAGRPESVQERGQLGDCLELLPTLRTRNDAVSNSGHCESALPGSLGRRTVRRPGRLVFWLARLSQVNRRETDLALGEGVIVSQADQLRSPIDRVGAVNHHSKGCVAESFPDHLRRNGEVGEMPSIHGSRKPIHLRCRPERLTRQRDVGDREHLDRVFLPVRDRNRESLTDRSGTPEPLPKAQRVRYLAGQLSLSGPLRRDEHALNPELTNGKEAGKSCADASEHRAGNPEKDR